MADQDPGNSKDAKESNGQPDKPDGSLRDFITNQIAQQNVSNQGNEVDNERTANFIARALGESDRMNREVKKSQHQIDELHNILGTERIEQWQTEHETEVLTKR